jgi:hypothetical protein
MNNENYSADRRMVLNGIIHAGDSANFIYLSESYPLFGQIPPDRYSDYGEKEVVYLTNIQSVLYKNEIPNADMHFRTSDNVLYFNENFNAGDQVKIEVSDQERKVSASAVIPEKPIIRAVDTIPFTGRASTIYYTNTSDYLRLLITLQDPPGQKNYYLIRITNELIYHCNQAYIDAGGKEFISLYSNTFSSDDPVLNKGSMNDFEIGGKTVLQSLADNYFSIFSDDLFQKEEYTLNLYTQDWRNVMNERMHYDEPAQKYVLSRKYRLRINLQAISKDLYLYYASLQRYIQLNETLIEPIRVYNNIQGGLGIFGAVNELEYVVLEKEIKNP